MRCPADLVRLRALILLRKDGLLQSLAWPGAYTGSDNVPARKIGSGHARLVVTYFERENLAWGE